MKKWKILICGFLCCGAVIAAADFFVSYAEVQPAEGQICKGVYIDDILLEGMTEDEAADALESYIDELRDRRVYIKTPDETIEAELHDFDYTCDDQEYITEALNIGKTGNIVKRYSELKNAQNENTVFNLNFQVDEKKLTEFARENLMKYIKKAKDATIKRENQQFVYTDSKTGQKIDIKDTVQKLKSVITENKEMEDITTEAVVVEDLPKYSKEDVSLCKDELSTFSTQYSTGAVNRSSNLSNAASLIDGSVVYPGEVFSVYEAIAPLDGTNGYLPAPSYENGEVVDSVGGGVCQVSTTLYNTVIRAELEIVERSPHSMVVAYVKPSMDAAIAGTYKDFKFKNNTDVPIYIMGGASGGTIYFKIFGYESRSSKRKISFESEVLETIDPGADKVTLDPSKPPSYMSVTQESHVGYRAKLWKTIKEKGKTEKVLMNTSSYAPSPRFVVKGSGKDPKDKKNPRDKKNSGKDNNPKGTKNPKETGKPRQTHSPRETEKPSRTPKPNSYSSNFRSPNQPEHTPGTGDRDNDG